jgi:hypothetical protein
MREWWSNLGLSFIVDEPVSLFWWSGSPLASVAADQPASWLRLLAFPEMQCKLLWMRCLKESTEAPKRVALT